MGLAEGRCYPSPTCLGARDDGDDVGGVEPTVTTSVHLGDLDEPGKSRMGLDCRFIRKGEGLDYVLKCNNYLHHWRSFHWLNKSIRKSLIQTCLKSLISSLVHKVTAPSSRSISIRAQSCPSISLSSAILGIKAS